MQKESEFSQEMYINTIWCKKVITKLGMVSPYSILILADIYTWHKEYPGSDSLIRTVKGYRKHLNIPNRKIIANIGYLEHSKIITTKMLQYTFPMSWEISLGTNWKKIFEDKTNNVR